MPTSAQQYFADVLLEDLARQVVDDDSTTQDRLRAGVRLAERILDRQAARRESIASGVRRHRVATAAVGILAGTVLFVGISRRRARRRREREIEERQRAQLPPWAHWITPPTVPPWGENR